jgi:HTH-type transcriptional regulator/antitoxin HigA
MSQTTFEPDWASAPGSTLYDLLEERGLSQMELARKLGLSGDEVRDLLDGRKSITPPIAQKLEGNIGAPANFWLRREEQYRKSLRRTGDEAAERSWLKSFPLREMARLGWIAPRTGQGSHLDDCLRFFGVRDVPSWQAEYGALLQQVAFRTSATFKSEPGAVAAWLREGERRGEARSCAPWDPKQFTDALIEIRRLTRKRDPGVFVPELERLGATSGVAIVVLPAPKGCRASGATCFLSPDRALLLLSVRYLSDDHFWFTVFHEAGHLILHGKQSLFLEGETPSTKQEDEANAFAQGTLIPEEFQQEFASLPIDRKSIRGFALRLGISPGIVIGQLQHLGRARPNQLNNLKARYSWGT